MRFRILVVLAGLLIIVTPVASFAQTKNIKGALQSIIESFGKLVISKSAKNDIAARLNAFKSVLDLAFAESNDLKNRLIKLDNVSGGELTLKEQYLRELGNHTTYYQSLIQELEKATTAAKIREIASQFKDWRRVVYHPALQRVTSFLLVIESRHALQTAEARYTRVTADLKKVAGYDVIKRGPLAGYLTAARTALDEAQKIQAVAGILIVKSSDANTQSLVTEIMDYIKTAYENFVKMSDWLRAASKK